jgi:hypothetical protein
MPPKDEFTAGELEVVTTVFRQYETGLREACIDAKVRLLVHHIYRPHGKRYGSV